MTPIFKKLTTFALAVPLAATMSFGLLTSTAAQADTIKIALAETPSDELAAFFVALDRAKANGLDYEWTAFADEELAIQSVLGGQMDIGFGTPYAAMQRSKAPIRIIYQLSKLKSTYIDALPGQIDSNTGRVHTSYRQAVAATVTELSSRQAVAARNVDPCSRQAVAATTK